MKEWAEIQLSKADPRASWAERHQLRCLQCRVVYKDTDLRGAVAPRQPEDPVEGLQAAAQALADVIAAVEPVLVKRKKVVEEELFAKSVEIAKASRDEFADFESGFGF